jgi:hypothetical protein
MANTITGSGGTITVAGGGVQPNAGAGASGRIRLEAYTFTAVVTCSTPPSLTQPGGVTLANNPTLTITSVGGVTVPASPGGAYATPDITLPAGTPSSVTVNLAASQIPPGITVKVRVTPQVGAPGLPVDSGGLSGTLASSTASAAVTIPLDQPFALDAEATFTLTVWRDSPVKYAGEEVTTVQVTARLGEGPQVRYHTASGTEVPAEAVLALGLPR